MKRKLAVLLSLVVAFMLVFAACGSSSQPDEVTSEDVVTEETVDYDGVGMYGYDGDDPVIEAAYKYMAEVVSKDYEEADVSIPGAIDVGDIVEDENGEFLLWGDFWVYNYNIEGDTLMTASGGDYPGVMHVAKNEDSTYEVTSMDVVADGEGWISSAKAIFGDRYDMFMTIYSDDEVKEDTRREAIQVYVQARGLSVKKYQDEGWDPVSLEL